MPTARRRTRTSPATGSGGIAISRDSNRRGATSCMEFMSMSKKYNTGVRRPCHKSEKLRAEPNFHQAEQRHYDLASCSRGSPGIRSRNRFAGPVEKRRDRARCLLRSQHRWPPGWKLRRRVRFRRKPRDLNGRHADRPPPLRRKCALQSLSKRFHPLPSSRWRKRFVFFRKSSAAPADKKRQKRGTDHFFR